MPDKHVSDIENWHNYQIQSRREIIALLRSIGEKNQLLRLLINGEADVAVTSILDVDVDEEEVIIDCAVSRDQNQRIISARRLGFETTLDKIRILFWCDRVYEAEYAGRPALSFPIPDSLIRLQRRDLYRVETPLTNPVRCVITLPDELGGVQNFPLTDISGGGIAITDEKMVLDNTIGRRYENCRIDLKDVGTVVVTLEVRGSMEQKLLNGKVNRRIGCQFVNLSRQMSALVQKFITKLERERNARLNGLA
ncbi:flagellar brake protein [Massilia sp. W12]|uniref:flagellar brake protein n=1 Tax=Massilia sp. W12 TaxID=3126507 RepID=UPI0030D14178